MKNIGPNCTHGPGGRVSLEVMLCLISIPWFPRKHHSGLCRPAFAIPKALPRAALSFPKCPATFTSFPREAPKKTTPQAGCGMKPGPPNPGGIKFTLAIHRNFFLLQNVSCQTPTLCPPSCPCRPQCSASLAWSRCPGAELSGAVSPFCLQLAPCHTV